MKYVDIIIVGSGISGLYSAYKIKQESPDTSFLILEQYKKVWIGGRTSNETFYGTEIVTGAGVGRKNKDKLLRNLLHDFQINTYEYLVNPLKSNLIHSIDINETMNYLKEKYKHFKQKNLTFKEFASKILGKKIYKSFILSSGYSDYENEDIYETLFNYGMEDNACCWKAFHVQWKKLIMKLYDFLGHEHFKFSSKVLNIIRLEDHPCKFLITLENGSEYTCNKIIIGSTIDTIRKLVPNPIYYDIEGQPFLRLYAKFSKDSIPVMKEYVKGYTFLPGPLQKIIPIDDNKGIYMISYSDNNNAIALKNNLENNETNRKLYQVLLEESLNIPKHSLHILAIKNYYWPIGTHYYKPLNNKIYKNREQFIYQAQHPENGILIVGEVVSKNQGWTEGALESVRNVVNKKWIVTQC
jgi:hypothetical protein